MPDTFDATARSDFAELSAHLARQLDAGGEDQLALLSDGPLSYAALRRGATEIRRGFSELGLAPGDRIAILSSRDRTTIELVVASLLSGVAPVVGDPKATADEFRALLAVCRPAAVFADPGMLEGLDPTIGPRLVDADRALSELRRSDAPPLGAEIAHGRPAPDIAMMILTSGTTSRPKAVQISYGALRAQYGIFGEVYGFDAATRLLNLLPLHHTDGLIRGPLCALWFGGSVVRPAPFSVGYVPEMLDLVAAERVTHFISVPATLRIVERLGRDRRDAFRTPDYRFTLSSADVLDAGLWRRVEEGFGAPVANAYGLSEVVCDAVFAGPGDATRRIGAIGRPHGVVAEILDDDGRPVPPGTVGELALGGATVMRGYFGDAQATRAVLRNDLFHTGDYARLAEDGLIEFVGRKKTAIVAAGVTIYPESVAAVLTTMPGVSEAVVFGAEDGDGGQILAAAVVPTHGRTLAEAEVAAFCRERLAPERRPRAFAVLDALPRGPSGKVLLEQLKRMAAARPAPADHTGETDAVLTIAAACFNLPVEALTPESTPFDTEGWDSLAHMTLIEEVELAHGFQFSPAEIAQIASLADVMEIVEKHAGAR